MSRMRSGSLAEFASPESMLEALTRLHQRGYRALETYTPFPVPEVDRILRRPPSRLPWWVLLGGLAGAAGAYALQWLVTAYLYPVHVGARPPHFPTAYVPITFEMGVLAAAFTGFVGVIAAGRLLHLWSPVAATPGFVSATNDRFWIAVDASDALFGASETPSLLRDLGASRTVAFGDQWVQKEALP